MCPEKKPSEFDQLLLGSKDGFLPFSAAHRNCPNIETTDPEVFQDSDDPADRIVLLSEQDQDFGKVNKSVRRT